MGLSTLNNAVRVAVSKLRQRAQSSTWISHRGSRHITTTAIESIPPGQHTGAPAELKDNPIVLYVQAFTFPWKLNLGRNKALHQNRTSIALHVVSALSPCTRRPVTENASNWPHFFLSCYVSYLFLFLFFFSFARERFDKLLK